MKSKGTKKVETQKLIGSSTGVKLSTDGHGNDDAEESDSDEENETLKNLWIRTSKRRKRSTSTSERSHRTSKELSRSHSLVKTIHK